MKQSSPEKDHQFKAIEEPLLYLKQSGISIYPQKLIQSSKKTHLFEMQTQNTLQDLEQFQKIISFANSDKAFHINEQSRVVKICRISNEEVQIEFQVKTSKELQNVQEILRKKLCEMGFEEKYSRIKQIGKGATANVELVQRKSDNKYFAAKIMSIKQSANKQYQSFINQTKILRYLKSQYIVQIESLYVSKKQLISVLEYLEGGTLLEELRNEKVLTRAQRFNVVRDMTLAVQHLRIKRIAHRDIKLENILVRKHENGKKDYVLTDFGLACWIGEKNLLFEKCGTPGYIAPEILRSGKDKVIVSHSSDIFSLGVIFHFVFVLKAVFPYNGNTRELLLKNRKANFSLDNKQHNNLQKLQLELLTKALQVDPKKRLSSNQLISLYIIPLEKQIKIKGKQKINNDKSGSIKMRKSKIMQNKSIEIEESRTTSIKKNVFSLNQKPQKKETTEKRTNSAKRIIQNLWNKIAPSKQKPKEESSLKQKGLKNQKKQQMREFLK